MKLVGKTRPCGESGVDVERLENLKALIELAEGINTEIQEIVKFKDSNCHSEYIIGCEAKKYFERLQEDVDDVMTR